MGGDLAISGRGVHVVPTPLGLAVAYKKTNGAQNVLVRFERKTTL